MKISPQERFGLKVKIMPNGCLEWQAGRFKDGYGQFFWREGRRNIGAHRAAWIFKNGPIPKGLDVLHSCDNPPCCNTNHLFLGTNDDNVKDRTRKGREAKGGKNGRSKLTAKQIIEIRKAYKKRTSRYWGSTEFAKRFGVDASAISFVATGKTWGHIDNGPRLPT